MDKRGGNTDDEKHGTDLRDVLKIKLTRLGDGTRGREKGAQRDIKRGLWIYG